MDFAQIIDMVKQIIALVEEAELIDKIKAVAPIIIEKFSVLFDSLGA